MKQNFIIETWPYITFKAFFAAERFRSMILGHHKSRQSVATCNRILTKKDFCKKIFLSVTALDYVEDLSILLHDGTQIIIPTCFEAHSILQSYDAHGTQSYDSWVSFTLTLFLLHITVVCCFASVMPWGLHKTQRTFIPSVIRLVHSSRAWEHLLHRQSFSLYSSSWHWHTHFARSKGPKQN